MPTDSVLAHPEHPRSIEESDLRLALRQRLGNEQCDRYFGAGTRLNLREDGLRVSVESTFLADLISRRFSATLHDAAREALARRVVTPPDRLPVHVGVDDTLAGVAPAPGSPPVTTERHPPAEAEQPRKPARAAPRRRLKRLDDFLVGECNRLAHAAVLRAVESLDGDTDAPLVFVHAACGLGKTHLLQGAADRVARSRPGRGVRYTTADAFTHEFVSAVQRNTTAAFRRAHRALDLLCIDDVHLLAAREKTQFELVQTLDVLAHSGTRVVLASDEHPRLIRQLSTALASRFMAGVVARIDAPEPALRERLVRELARRRGIRLDDAGLRLLLHELAAGARGDGACSPREIEGALHRIEAVARLGLAPSAPDGSLGLPAVRRALGMDEPAPTSRGWPGRPIRIDAILDEVCRRLQVERDAVVGKGRHRRVVAARALTAHLARALTTHSFPEIAAHLGRPNHSSVVTACQRVARQLSRGEAVALGLECDGLLLSDLCDRIAAAVRAAPPRAASA